MSAVLTATIWSKANKDVCSSHCHYFRTVTFNTGAAVTSSVYT